MADPTAEQLQDATKIIDALIRKHADSPHEWDDEDLWQYTRHVYNDGIYDCIEFVKTLAVHNPQHRLALMSLETELKKWLPIVERTTE